MEGQKSTHCSILNCIYQIWLMGKISKKNKTKKGEKKE